MVSTLARTRCGRGELVFGEGGLDPVGEALQVAGALRAAELDDLLAGRRGQRLGGGPAFQQPQDPGRAQILPGDGQRGGEGDDQVGAQPVEQPPLVPAGPLVVAGDRPQLPGDLPVRDQPLEPGVPVQREQAADPGVFGVVFLACRAAPPRYQLRVDRQHRVPGPDQRLDQQPVPGLEHHPHLSRVRLQPGDPCHQGRHRLRTVRDPHHIDDPLTGTAERHHVELLGPVDPYAQHTARPS